MKSIFISIILLSIVCCQKSENKLDHGLNDYFEVQFQIVGQEIVNDIVQTNFYKDILRFDDQLILTSTTEPFVTVLRSDTVKQFIQAGSGPNELPNQFLRLTRDFSTGAINVFHKSTGKHYLMNLVNGNLKFIGTFSVNYINLDYVHEETMEYIGIGYFKNRYAISDTSGDVVEELFPYPLSDNLFSTSVNAISMAYQGEFKKHPTRKLFYSATLLAPIFEIVKYKENQFTTVRSWAKGYPKIRDQSNGNTITLEYEVDCEISFVNSSCTEKYIYLLYSGKEHGGRKQRSIDPYLSNQVLVYDWKGNPICILRLDREVKAISVDENDEVLYCIYRERNTLQEGLRKYSLEKEKFITLK